MALNVGDWVDLGGIVGRVAEVSDDLVIAEAATGGDPIERPRSFAELRWTRLSEEGLMVQLALDAGSVLLAAVQSPVDVIAAALVDLHGEATTLQIKERIVPQVVDQASWTAWWTRAQARIANDSRIDASRSRDQRYRLLGEGERPIERTKPTLRDETRAGRRLADAPQLREARKVARRHKPLDADEEALIELEVAIAAVPDVDPTDRFMAAELGVWTRRMDEDTAKRLLGQDLVRVDLLRIPQAESRSVALSWAASLIDHDDAGSWQILRSAAASGSPWYEEALSIASERLRMRRAIGEGMLGWAVPGSEEAGTHRYPEDLEIFERRIARALEVMRDADAELVEGIGAGAVAALETLPENSGLHEAAWRRVMDSIASCVYQATQKIRDKHYLPLLRPVAIEALVRTWPRDELERLETVVTTTYKSSPADYDSVFIEYCRAARLDPTARALDLARSSVPAPVRMIAQQAFARATGASDDPGVIAEVASLVGTLIPDDRRARDILDQLADDLAAQLVAGKDPAASAVWFSHGSWRRFANRILGRLEEASAREAKAVGEVERLQSELAEVRTALEYRTEALTATRATEGSDKRSDSERQAAAILKPIAGAVSDSFEAESIDALRDRILAVLGRYRLRPLGSVGEMQEYDPARHQWVGDGLPTEHVRLLSPGFAIHGDEEGAVLIPARVIEPRS